MQQRASWTGWSWNWICRALWAVLAAMLFSFPSTSGAAQPESASPNVLSSPDGWRVSFDAASSTLECAHPATSTVLKGRLSFVSVIKGKRVDWSIQPVRDSFPHRLAIVDSQNDTQGYIAASASGGRLLLTVLHRPPHDYEGELLFEPEIRFGADSFACRTQMPVDGAVVQMASGGADSLLNDSIFDPDRDCVLHLTGKNVALVTQPGTTGQPALFQARLTAQPGQEGAAAAIACELQTDYYRSRYVPNYHRIDRRRCPKAPTGWMSWNVYFDAATENDDLAEARVAARELKPFGLEFWSIESWQENSPRLPVSKFYNLNLRASPEKFPHGMKWMADQIRELGFRPGIWVVSFGTGEESFYQAHRDWFLHDKSGKPMKNWNGLYILDPSQAAVRQFTEENHRKMSAEWGYEFFKCDGMSGRGPGYSAHFFERPEVRAAFREPCADPYGTWVETMRRGIGPDRVLLACQGHYSGPDAAVADAARIGGDIVHFPHPPDWKCYLNQAEMTQYQLFVNNLLWYNDPDTLMVGEFASLGVARLATTVVALPGQLTFFGDKLAQLPPERMRLLKQALPVCDVRPLDLVPVTRLKPVWDLKIRRPFASWDVVSVFNWETNALARKVTFAELGLPSGKEYLAYDFWNRKFLGAHPDGLEINVEPQANALLAVHERLDRPQLLSTDRHISQGGVEWISSSWDGARGELSCGFKLVANEPLTAVIHVPPGYQFGEATADGAEVKDVSTTAPPLLCVKLQRATNGEARLVARFKK